MSEKVYLYGRNPLEEAITASKRDGVSFLEKVFLTKQAEEDSRVISLIHSNKIPYSVVTSQEIESMVGRGAVHQGVCASITTSALYRDLREVASTTGEKHPCLVLLDELEDPHNVGAIIRSSVAFGATAILMPEHGQVGVTSTVVKTSAGAIFSIPIVKIGNINTTLITLKEKGFWIYGLTGEGKTSLHDAVFDAPTVVVVGSEGRGIREKTLDLCDFSLSIPISDACESLNASNAVAVTLYEWSKQNK